MAVHILFRPPAAAAAAAAGPSGSLPPSPDAAVRRSARLVLHTTSSPPLASSSTSTSKRAAKQKAGSSPATSTSSTSSTHARKRARPSEPHTSQTESESDSERPVSPTKPRTARRTLAATPTSPPAGEPTPRAVRAQKRQRLSAGSEAELPFRLAPAPKRAPSPVKSIPPPNATKTRAAKRKSMDSESRQAREEDDLDREACPPSLKKKRKENAHKASPAENNHPQTIKKAIKGKEKEKEKEKDVVKVPVAAAPTPRVVSLRPRRRSAGSAGSTTTSKSTSPHVESIKDSPADVPPTTRPLSSDADKAESTSAKKESEAAASPTAPCPPTKEPSESAPLAALISCPSPAPSSPLSSLSTSPAASPTPTTKPLPLVSSTPATSSTTPSSPPPPSPSANTSSSNPSSSNTASSNPASSSPPPSPIRAAVHPHAPAHTHAITQPHIHSPLTPLAHTTTPPSSPPMHAARTSPPLDAVDLGPLPPLCLPGPAGVSTSSGSSSPSNGTRSTHSSPVSSPPLSPVAGPAVPAALALVGENTPTDAATATSMLFAGATSPITLPTIPTAFLGPFADAPMPASQDVGPARQDPPAQQQEHHFIQPFDAAEGGMPLPLPLMDVIGGMGLGGMGMALPLQLGGMGLPMPLAMGLPMSLPMSMPMLGMPGEPMASESELGFGFQPQEGFVGGGGGAGYVGEGERREGEPGQQQFGGMAFEPQQQQQSQQSEQQQPGMYAPDAAAQFEPTQMQLQDAAGQQQQQTQQQQFQQQQQSQQQQQQQQQRPASPPPSMRLTLKQQRKLTYPEPTPLEDPPSILKDTGLWATACKLRIWEMSKRYTPDVMRAVTVQDAEDHFTRTGAFPLGYKRAGSLRHHRKRSSLSSVLSKGKRRARRSPVDADGDEAMEDGDGDDDDDAFMSEKTYYFELLDDEELESGGGEGAWDEDAEMDGGVDGEGYEYEDYDEEEEWDEEEEDEEDETDEDEEVEEALEALKKSASLSPTSPTASAARAPSPASPTSAEGAAAPALKVPSTNEDGAVLSGDEDAEGEMEVDIEAFSDPSFNAELSSPTSPATPAAPLSPDEGRVSVFYVPPPLSFSASYGGPQTWVEEPTPVDAAQPQMMQLDQQPEQQGAQTPPPVDAPALEEQHQPQQLSADQPAPQQHQAPIQIQLTPASQPYFPPLLPLPPPRLDTIRVAYLRQAELGAKLTGRGTPADRARAAQWARGYIPPVEPAPVRLSPGKRRPEEDDLDAAEGRERARPRLRLELQDGSEGALALGLPDGIAQPAVGVQEGAHTVASDAAHWDAFLACLDKSDAQHDGSGTASASSSSSTGTGNLDHVSVSALASSAYTTPRPSSPAPPSDSSSNSVPAATGEGMFGLGLFDMSMGFASLLGPANAWFGGAEGAPDASSSSAVVGASEPQQESLEMKAAVVASGTSTLSFALG